MQGEASFAASFAGCTHPRGSCTSDGRSSTKSPVKTHGGSSSDGASAWSAHCPNPGLACGVLPRALLQQTLAVWAGALCIVPASCLGALNMSICSLQELYGDIQRTTEQMVKDKLEEQQVSTYSPAHTTCRQYRFPKVHLEGCKGVK